MFWLLIAHLGGIVGAGYAGARRGMHTALAVAAVAPAAATVWAISRLAGSGDPTVAQVTWVEGLDLNMRLRADSLALLMTVLVSGIGALIFLFAIGYFRPQSDGAVRFPATLLAFSTSMLGLVWADSIWTLFVFWELTSVTSFLLVGHRHVDAGVRTAARRALVITGGGGLILLAGLLLLQQEGGSTTLTGLPAVSGTTGTVAAVLVMIGAATKSAQVPFHVWLPGAMAAPTPVSAYLHSATMVKAGVLLIAVTGGAFADVAIWKTLGLVLGISSLLWGGIGALRHRDAKLILAWGTVSQLGLLVTLLAAGTGKAVFAAVSMLFAHALFKAALFVVVGEIDVRTGTRDITELGGLHRTMPGPLVVGVLAGLSMAGLPPLLGFPAKEAAIEAVLGLEGAEALVVGAGVVGGSVLTVAYTLRLLHGLFGPGPETVVSGRRLALSVPGAVLAGAGLVGFVALDVVNDIVRPAAVEVLPAADAYELLRWPGFTTALLVSAAIVAAGALVGGYATRSQQRRVPAPVGATTVDRSVDGLLDAAPTITSRIQHGSLPVYLATMAAVAAVAATPLVLGLSTDHLVLWDQPLQAVLALVVVGAAVVGALVGSRLGAALTLGAVGIGMAGLFVLHGAPDLALTQLLVETIIVVGFVVGLGHLSRRFPSTDRTWRVVRVVVALGAGVTAAVGLAAAGGSPAGVAPVRELTTEAVDTGGGKNLVNVILTDVRALDTLGEVVVLAVVAVGIIALARAGNREVSR